MVPGGEVSMLMAAPEAQFRPGTASREANRADCRDKRIGILVVAYNAVTTLSAVLKRIPEDVWANVEEVAVFDDASKDATQALAVGYKVLSGLEKLTVLRNEKNLGYGGNQKLGYEYFAAKGFDVVVLLHGDGQYAPEILAEMYGPIVRGEADAVFGSRMMPDFGGPRKGGMPLYKLLGNKILTFCENRALGMHLTEFHSGYRAYSLDTLRRVDMSRMTNDFHFDTEIIIKLNHQGFRIKEIPIPTYYGNEICYVNGMKYARDVYRALRHYKRTLRGVKTYGEFAEYHVHYPLKEGRFSSHAYFQQYVGRDADVLDVGCGEGFFAAKVAEAGNRVVGIDLLERPKESGALTQYIRADLEQGLEQAKPMLQGRTFDRVMLQDVLEHLRQPERMLKDCAAMLKPNGLLLVSVPNVANITVRLALLCGQFNYTQRGILDQTHVRFYTRKTARKLLRRQGYEILREAASVMPVDVRLGVSPQSWPMRLVNVLLRTLTLALPGVFGYQCLFVARRSGAAE